MRQDGIVRVTTKLLIAPILLFALYVQFHGDYGPGGGFQAGVIFAAAIIIYGLVFGIGAGRQVAQPRLIEIGAALGVLLYAGSKVLQVAAKMRQKVLDNDDSPKGRVGQNDNRTSHYHFARYWAEAVAAQTEDKALAEAFAPIAKALAENEEKILAEIHAAEGSPADLGGYYLPDEAKVASVMRPSATLNGIIG